MKGGRGTLAADVTTGGGAPRTAVPLVTFIAKDFTPKDGLAALTEAPATLTEDGAETFGSLYRAGTAMDRVSLAVTVDTSAKLPALPDLGSDAGASAGPSPAAASDPPAGKAGTDDTDAVSASSSGSSHSLVRAGVGAAVLLAAAFAVYAGVRRRTPRAEAVAVAGAGTGPGADPDIGPAPGPDPGPGSASDQT